MRPMLTACVAALALWGCSAPPADVEVLRHYPLDSLEGVITRSAVALDEQVTSDGGGSLRISAAGPTTVRLFETGDIEAEAARLLFRARLRTEDLKGTAFLEMWVSVPGRGEFFSRGLTSPLTGTTDWATAETPFLLREGEDPDNVRLNVVVDGAGTVWVDDVRLLKGPLEEPRPRRSFGELLQKTASALSETQLTSQEGSFTYGFCALGPLGAAWFFDRQVM